MSSLINSVNESVKRPHSWPVHRYELPQKRVRRLELLYVTKRRIEIFLKIQVKKAQGLEVVLFSYFVEGTWSSYDKGCGVQGRMVDNILKIPIQTSLQPPKPKFITQS